MQVHVTSSGCMREGPTLNNTLFKYFHHLSELEMLTWSKLLPVQNLLSSFNSAFTFTVGPFLATVHLCPPDIIRTMSDIIHMMSDPRPSRSSTSQTEAQEAGKAWEGGHKHDV